MTKAHHRMKRLSKGAVPMQPPSSTVPAVLAHRCALETSVAALKADIPAALLASAQGKAGARAALRRLRQRIQDLEFEIDRNPDAVDLARKHDEAACDAWRKAVHSMPPDEAIEGLSADNCCGRCLRGTPGGCVLSGGDPYSATCLHPVQGIRLKLFNRDIAGKRIFPHSEAPKAQQIFDAACEKLGVRKEFA